MTVRATEGSERTGSDLHSRELRNAFGAYPTGVTVATCLRKRGGPIGVTANSFVSLSLSPPLVSIALHAAARHLGAFLDCGTFAINVLRADQYGLSNLFARPSESSCEEVGFRVTASEHVVLEGAAASFLCRLRAQHPVGDHVLLVGEVESFAYDARVEPLAFLRGRYGTFQLATQTAAAAPIDAWAAPAIGWG